MAYRYGLTGGEDSLNCWTTHSAVGWQVTLKCRVLRRPCSMTKAVTQPLRHHRRHIEEVERDDHLTVLRQEGNPPLRWILGAPQSRFPIGRHRIRTRISLVIFGLAPRGRERHRQYKRKPARCQPTTVSRLHDDTVVTPSGPHAAEERPKESVQGVHCWLRPFAFELGKLLPKGEDFEGDVAATAKEFPDGVQD